MQNNTGSQTVRRRTGYKDRNGNNIYEGDTVEGCFTAPWDEDCGLMLAFTVVKKYGCWFCEGVKYNHQDNLLKYFRCLEVVTPSALTAKPETPASPESESA